MKDLHSKRGVPSIFGPLFMWLSLTLVFSSSMVFAVEENAKPTGEVPYQSAFEDYRAISKDVLTDWKAINQSSEGGGHSGHQMQGMQHDMPSGESKSAQSSMDHGSMDHSKMVPDNGEVGSTANDKTHHDMTKMDHQSMNHDMPSGKSLAISNSKANSEMSAMDHAKMTDMQHQHGANDSSMAKVNHSQMENMPQPSNSVEASDPEAAPDAGGSENAMQGHDMTKSMSSMEKMSDTSETTAQPSNTGFRIIPNMHPAAVHFPIALTLIALLFSFDARMLGKHSSVPLLAAAGHFTLWLAALGAVVAVILGWLAFSSGMNHNDAGHAAMLLHRKWAIPTALGLVVLAGWDVWQTRLNQVMSFPTLALLFVLSAAVANTAWLGGEVVYRHGIGVMSLPASKGVGHSHQHNSGHSDEATTLDENTEQQHDATQGESHAH